MGRRRSNKKNNKNKKSRKDVRATPDVTATAEGTTEASTSHGNLCNHECPEMNFYQWCFFLEMLMLICLSDGGPPIHEKTKILQKYSILVHDPSTTSIAICLASNIFLTCMPEGIQPEKGIEYLRLVLGAVRANVEIAILTSTGRKAYDKAASGNTDADEAYLEGLARMKKRWNKLATPRDIILYLDRKIPCDCLRSLKEHFLSLPDSHCCDACGKVCLDENIYECGKCNAAEYCSRECQLKSWPDHQHICKLIRGKLKIQDVQWQGIDYKEWSHYFPSQKK